MSFDNTKESASRYKDIIAGLIFLISESFYNKSTDFSLEDTLDFSKSEALKFYEYEMGEAHRVISKLLLDYPSLSDLKDSIDKLAEPLRVSVKKDNSITMDYFLRGRLELYEHIIQYIDCLLIGLSGIVEDRFKRVHGTDKLKSLNCTVKQLGEVLWP